MDQPLNIPPALATTATAHPPPPPPPPPQRGIWTPAKQRIFLAALRDLGSVARAARAAGMSRSSAHRLRQRLRGTPFDHAWDGVLKLHASRMADPFAPDVAPRQAPR